MIIGNPPTVERSTFCGNDISIDSDIGSSTVDAPHCLIHNVPSSSSFTVVTLYSNFSLIFVLLTFVISVKHSGGAGPETPKLTWNIS